MKSTHRWFHTDCLRIDTIHTGKWHCRDCRKIPKQIAFMSNFTITNPQRLGHILPIPSTSQTRGRNISLRGEDGGGCTLKVARSHHNDKLHISENHRSSSRDVCEKRPATPPCLGQWAAVLLRGVSTIHARQWNTPHEDSTLSPCKQRCC